LKSGHSARSQAGFSCGIKINTTCKNYLQIDPTHVHPGAQVLGLAGEHMLPQVEVAKAVFGTDSEATIGKATIAATPIFFKTSRLLMPYDGILPSKRFSRFN
jgi:predicted membrane protein